MNLSAILLSSVVTLWVFDRADAQIQYGIPLSPSNFDAAPSGGYPSSNFGHVNGHSIQQQIFDQTLKTNGQKYGDSSANENYGVEVEEGGKIFKYISVHDAPKDPSLLQPRVLKLGGKPNKHVDVIFVKSPSGESERPTDIILPEPDEHQSLVYVLLKKDFASNIRVQRPKVKKPAKPQVYFIKYHSNKGKASAASLGDGASFTYNQPKIRNQSFRATSVSNTNSLGVSNGDIHPQQAYGTPY